jgi:undecaprenyl-diphosphatase
MLLTLLDWDKEVFLYLNGLGTASWDGFWLVVTNKWTSVPLYLCLLGLTLRSFGLKRTLIILLTVALLITVTDQLANFFKYGVQRLRPCHEPGLRDAMRLVQSYCGGNYGFYSAHASNSMGLAVFFACLMNPRYRGLGGILVFWALIVSYSRIYVGVHYPLDVITGIMAGFLMGWLFTRLYLKAIFKFRL